MAILHHCASCQGMWAQGNSVLLCLPPRDYHKKQNALRALQKKALDKNPDEFYFKMIRTQLKVRKQIALR